MSKAEKERNQGRGAITPAYRYWPDNWLLKADNEDDDSSGASKNTEADEPSHRPKP